MGALGPILLGGYGLLCALVALEIFRAFGTRLDRQASNLRVCTYLLAGAALATLGILSPYLTSP